jgi:hypothetical protein
MALDVRILIESIKLWIVLVTAVQKAVVAQPAARTDVSVAQCINVKIVTGLF